MNTFFLLQEFTSIGMIFFSPTHTLQPVSYRWAWRPCWPVQRIACNRRGWPCRPSLSIPSRQTGVRHNPWTPPWSSGGLEHETSRKENHISHDSIAVKLFPPNTSVQCVEIIAASASFLMSHSSSPFHWRHHIVSINQLICILKVTNHFSMHDWSALHNHIKKHSSFQSEDGTRNQELWLEGLFQSRPTWIQRVAGPVLSADRSNTVLGLHFREEIVVLKNTNESESN